MPVLPGSPPRLFLLSRAPILYGWGLRLQGTDWPAWEPSVQARPLHWTAGSLGHLRAAGPAVEELGQVPPGRPFLADEGTRE